MKQIVKIPRISKKNMVILILTTALLIMTSLCIFMAWKLLSKSFSYDWHTETTPLSEETKQDVCQILDLDAVNDLCIPNYTAYGPDFYPILKELLLHAGQETANFDEVEKLIGKYKYLQGPLTELSDGGIYFNAYYDFTEDHRFPLLIRFTSDGRIIEIIYTLSD